MLFLNFSFFVNKIIKLEPDYCCGGGHCGILPGYFYECPYCQEEANMRLGTYLELEQTLQCDYCHKSILAKKKINDFCFEFFLLD